MATTRDHAREVGRAATVTAENRRAPPVRGRQGQLDQTSRVWRENAVELHRSLRLIVGRGGQVGAIAHAAELASQEAPQLVIGTMTRLPLNMWRGGASSMGEETSG